VRAQGPELPAEPSPLTVDGEDEALLVPAGRVQRHAHIGARAGKLQARELQHPRAWKKWRAGSLRRLEQDQVQVTVPASWPVPQQPAKLHARAVWPSKSLFEVQDLAVHSSKGC